MSEPRLDQKAVDAVAEAWASIDGKLHVYRAERDLPPLPYDDPTYTGHYEGYLSEAEEMIRRIRSRGFDIVRIG